MDLRNVSTLQGSLIRLPDLRLHQMHLALVFKDHQGIQFLKCQCFYELCTLELEIAGNLPYNFLNCNTAFDFVSKVLVV